MSEQDLNNKLSLVEISDSPLADETPWQSDEVAPGKKITMHFEVLLKGEGNMPDRVVDSNFASSPVSFALGDGSLLPGFDKAILGLRVGDAKTLSIACENAFGVSNEDNVLVYPRYQFPADLVLEKGLMISFSDAAGNDQAGVVQTFDSEKVTMDFNHPLAGQDIDFKVKIIAVEEKGEQG